MKILEIEIESLIVTQLLIGAPAKSPYWETEQIQILSDILPHWVIARYEAKSDIRPERKRSGLTT